MVERTNWMVSVTDYSAAILEKEKYAILTNYQGSSFVSEHNGKRIG